MSARWWQRLPAAQRREYERSAAIDRVAVSSGPELAAAVEAIRAALEADDRAATERAAHALVTRICSRLGLPPVAVRVSGIRPHDTRGELHGLYTPQAGRGRDQITVWMRTAMRRDVVATRTFLRTLLHEVCHHVDTFALSLPNSFHTPGFYRRESSLFRAVTHSTSLGVAASRRSTRIDPEREAVTAAHEVARAAQQLGLGGADEAAGTMSGIELLRATAAAIASRQRGDE
jgi:hypothetical protein